MITKDNACAGPPKSGKTGWLCDRAVEMLQQGRRVIFITQENRKNDIFIRITKQIGIDMFEGRIDLEILYFEPRQFSMVKFVKMFYDEYPDVTFIVDNIGLMQGFDQGFISTFQTLSKECRPHRSLLFSHQTKR